MARTKSTGGKVPRKQLATKATRSASRQAVEELAARKAEEEKELEAQELAAQKTATETRRLVRWVDGEYYAVKEIVGRKFLQKSKVWKYEVKWEDGGERNWV
jgi:hypothetical protein